MEQTRRNAGLSAQERFIAGQIDIARDVTGWSVAELARRSLIDASRLGRLLRCERHMRTDELLRLCYALQVSPLTLVSKELRSELDRAGRRRAGA